MNTALGEALRAAARILVPTPIRIRAAVGGIRGLARPEMWRTLRDDEQARVVAAAVLGRGSCCVDVGANAGTFLELFTELAPNGRHIAFEPVPSVCAALRGRFPDVDVRAVALSDHDGDRPFYVHRRLASRSSLRRVGFAPEELETITVPVRTLDGSLPEGFAPRLIKLDVEGAELEVLRGALGTLQRHRPVVLFEHQASTARYFDSSPEAVVELLAEAGLRVFDMDGAGPYSGAGLRAVYERGRRWNFLAAPSE